MIRFPSGCVLTSESPILIGELREAKGAMMGQQKALAVSEETASVKGAASVATRIELLRSAIEQGADAFDPWVSKRASEEITRVEQRLNAGFGVTVAALAGGTGSGKSTLFNAITRLDFADPGALRPTTQQASACLWNADASEVLDMLDVKESRRIDYYSILTDGSDDLDSLVLLDLPDHDSIDVRNSILVDKTLPLVDMLIWVLDPQKYADQLIHEGYLKAMRARRDHMIVLLNHMDTVPEKMADELIEDVKRLLQADGLGNVPLFPVSAKKRTGLAPVMDAIRKAVETTEASVATAHAELDAVRRRLSGSVGVAEPKINDAYERMNDSLAQATGIPAVAESIRQSGDVWRKKAVVRADQPSAALTVAVRDAWIASVKKGLPPLWQKKAAEVTPDAEKIRRSVGGAVRSVEPRVGKRSVAYASVVCGCVLLVLALVAAIMGSPFAGVGARIAIAVSGVLCAGVGYFLGRVLRIRASRNAASAYEIKAREAVNSVTSSLLFLPAEELLRRHRDVRESLQV